MLKISAQLNDRDFQGTAEELATFVSEKLAELGFGERHRSSERLVRFYAYQKLLSRPEKAPDDGRQRLFGQLQVRQLLLARLLAERGWDLDRIRTLLLQNQEINSLNKLIDELATPTEAEKLFFRTRSSDDVAVTSQLRSELRVHSARMPTAYSQRDEMAEPSAPAYKPARKSSFTMVQQMKQIAETEESPADALRLMIKRSWRATTSTKPPAACSISSWPSIRPPEAMSRRPKDGPKLGLPIGAKPTSTSIVA